MRGWGSGKSLFIIFTNSFMPPRLIFPFPRRLIGLVGNFFRDPEFSWLQELHFIIIFVSPHGFPVSPPFTILLPDGIGFFFSLACLVTIIFLIFQSWNRYPMDHPITLTWIFILIIFWSLALSATDMHENSRSKQEINSG